MHDPFVAPQAGKRTSCPLTPPSSSFLFSPFRVLVLHPHLPVHRPSFLDCTLWISRGTSSTSSTELVRLHQATLSPHIQCSPASRKILRTDLRKGEISGRYMRRECGDGHRALRDRYEYISLACKSVTSHPHMTNSLFLLCRM